MCHIIYLLWEDRQAQFCYSSLQQQIRGGLTEHKNIHLRSNYINVISVTVYTLDSLALLLGNVDTPIPIVLEHGRAYNYQPMHGTKLLIQRKLT